MFAYFDATFGISGDMCLGALVDAGAPFNQIKEMLRKLPLQGWDMQERKVQKHGIAATQIEVSIPHEHVHRHLSDITKIIRQAQFPAPVEQNCLAIFQNLAAAEAAVHGTDIEKVHFHEVGAMDAILDICGTVCGLFLLEIDEIMCSPLGLGHGMIECAHGLMPVPAPAVVKLLAGKNIPLAPDLPEAGELCTPTGAAIITTLAGSFGLRPAMELQSCGQGAGQKEFSWPNVLRIYVAKKKQ